MTVIVCMKVTVGMWEAGKYYAVPKSMADRLVETYSASVATDGESHQTIEVCATKTMKPGQVLRGGL